MFLSGTFGLSAGVALYPTEELKDEYWSPYRRVTDLPVDPAAIEAALQKVAATFFTKLDVAPSGAGVAMTIAIDPTLVTFDMLRTSVSLQLEAVGIPSAGLAATLDQIQRREMLVKSRGGNVTRVEATFFLPVQGFTLDPWGRISTESEKAAQAAADRAETEKKRAESEVKSEDKKQRLLELKQRSDKDAQIVGAKLETIEEQKKTADRETEIAALRADKERLEKAAADAEARATEAKKQLDAIRAREATKDEALTDEAREARRESLVRAQENLMLERIARAAMPEIVKELIGKTPRERAEILVPVIRPKPAKKPIAKKPVVVAKPKAVKPKAVKPKAVKPKHVKKPVVVMKKATRAQKIQDKQGRWRDRRGHYVKAPRRSKKS